MALRSVLTWKKEVRTMAEVSETVDKISKSGKFASW
jgi:hypothetical protein